MINDYLTYDVLTLLTAEQSEKDEMMQSANSQILKKGAVRILPPSPQTVRKNVVAESASQVQVHNFCAIFQSSC